MIICKRKERYIFIIRSLVKRKIVNAYFTCGARREFYLLLQKLVTIRSGYVVTTVYFSSMRLILNTVNTAPDTDIPKLNLIYESRTLYLSAIFNIRVKKFARARLKTLRQNPPPGAISFLRNRNISQRHLRPPISIGVYVTGRGRS